MEPELLSPLVTGPFRYANREASENLKATALRTVKIYSIARRQAAAAQWQASTGSQSRVSLRVGAQLFICANRRQWYLDPWPLEPDAMGSVQNEM